MRSKQGSVVLQAGLGKEDGYKRVDVEIRKGRPRAIEGATRFYARFSVPPSMKYTDAAGKARTGRVVEPVGNDLDKAWIACQNIELRLQAMRLGHELPASITGARAKPVTDAAKETIADAVNEFIEYSRSRVNDWRNGADNGLSPNSFEAYRKASENFAVACAEMGAVHMSELSDESRGEAIILNFKTWLQRHVVRRKQGKAAYSDARKFTVIGQLLARNGFKMKTDRTFNPNDSGIAGHADIPRVKKPSIGDVVYYTPADIKAMLMATERVHDKSIYDTDDLKDLLLTFLWTGMRDEEIQHLTWADINWKNGDGRGKITVQDKPKYDWRVKDHEKRVITMNDKLRKRLRDRFETKGKREPRNGSELVFPSSVGMPCQNFADHINSLQTKAEKGGGKQKPYVFSRPETRKHVLHNFRKSYATYAMLQGATPRNIQHDLGHSELETTERYLALVEAPDKVRREYETIV